MNFYQFRATVGEDQVIRLATGVAIPPGDDALIVSTPILLPERDPSDPDPMAGTRNLLLDIAAEAETLAPDDLPTDMAEDHDQYALLRQSRILGSPPDFGSRVSSKHPPVSRLSGPPGSPRGVEPDGRTT